MPLSLKLSDMERDRPPANLTYAGKSGSCIGLLAVQGDIQLKLESFMFSFCSLHVFFSLALSLRTAKSLYEHETKLGVQTVPIISQ